jgi:hypothetical protein
MGDTGPAYAAVYKLVWQVKGEGARRRVVRFAGVVNEYFDYGDLLYELSAAAALGPAEVVLDCADIARMNSEGVARWVRFVTALTRYGAALTYRRCSPALVTQLNQVPEVIGSAHIESVLAPYRCRETAQEELRLVTLAPPVDLAHPPRFSDERGTWELDDVAHNYFAFALR